MSALQKSERRAAIVLVVAAIIVGVAAAIIFFVQTNATFQESEGQQESGQIAPESAETSETVERAVSMGQTTSLSPQDGPGILCDWATGTMEFTVDRAVVYDSLADASASEELGTVVQPIPPEFLLAASADGSAATERLLVLEVTIHNIDAVAYDSKNQDLWGIKSELSINNTSDLATFSGSLPFGDPKDNQKFRLAPGETGTYLVGFWIRSDTDLSTLTAGIGWADNLEGRAPITVRLDVVQGCA